MPVKIEITFDDIAFAEKILLPQGKKFDAERIDFIQNRKTIDLQAVPGSGKTTALLAKLLIFEKYLPFEDGSGILVISHTNAAIDEIKNKIGKHCPRLSKYPNFIGTIQRFVDEFLAIPFGHNFLNTRISWVDSEKFKDALWSKFSNIYWSKEYGSPGKFFWCRLIKKANKVANQTGRDQRAVCNEFIKEEVQDLYFDYRDNKIKFFRDNSTLLADETKNIYQGIKYVIENVIHFGIISYDYAYKMALCYCERLPQIRDLLQKRFRYVFVDEMQDMDEDQYSLLEKIFYDRGDSISKFQRIGDKNQAIYNGVVKIQGIWLDRLTVLPLNGSHRLTRPIADVVNCFALEKNATFNVNGLRKGDIKPHILVFENDAIENVIPKYAEIIKQLQVIGKIPSEPKHPFKVIAWNTDWKNQDDRDNPRKIRLVEYHQQFKKENHRPRNDYDNLIGYLRYFEKKKKTLVPIRKNILNSFLKILRLEGVKDEKGKQYTKRKLINHLREIEPVSVYEGFKLKLYNWSIKAIQGENCEALQEIKEYVPEFLELFGQNLNNSRGFVNAEDEQKNNHEREKIQELSNVLNFEGLNLEIATVHSSKGQTHCATLYLETYYQNNYESERLAEQIKGCPFPANEDRKYHKHSTVMSYVGLSRPTHLLCLAIHKSRFDEHLTDIDKTKWEVIEV